MHQKIHQLINGGMALYYGVGLAIVSVCVLVMMVTWVIDHLQGMAQISWDVFGGMTGLAIIFGLAGNHQPS